MSIPAVANPSHSQHPCISPLEPSPPGWVLDVLRLDTGASPLATMDAEGLLEVARGDRYARVSARIVDAVSLEAADLTNIVAARYAAIAAMVGNLRKHPIRFWNYVPGIVESMASGMDRYMAFNRGRHAAYQQAWGTGDGFERSVPAASGVGIAGSDLVIDCLCADTRAVPVENPRQIASWRYSRRYGPRPPCFARGSVTTIAGRRVLLIAGTASIVGEESQHAGDAQAQVGEILRNIDALIACAGRTRPDPLEQLTEVRIYVVHADDIAMVEREVRARTRPDVRIESAVARVCRPELLVEIEGVAAL